MNEAAGLRTMQGPEHRRYARFVAEGAWQWSVLLAGLAWSGAVVIPCKEAWTGVAGPAILVLAGVIAVRADLLHPYTWYVPLYFLYSCSVPLLVWLGIRDDPGLLHEAVVLQWLGMSAFMVTVGPRVLPIAAPPRALAEVRGPAIALFAVAGALSALYLAYVWQAGLDSKYAIALGRSPFLRLDHAFPVLILLFGVLLGGSLLRRRFPLALTLGVTAWLVLALLVCGERDFILRGVWLAIFLVHAWYRRLPAPLLLSALVMCLLAVNLLGSVKNALVSAEPVSISMEQEEIMFLPDEFVTASENLEFLLRNAPDDPPLWGESLWWDVKRALLPGFVDSSTLHPQAQFNQRFWSYVVEAGGGRGFTLVGEGYMNFGTAGVLIWLGLMGLLARILYSKGASHPFWLVLYVGSMPLMVYVTRSDFSNLLAQLSKHVFLPAFMLCVLRDLTRNRKGSAGANRPSKGSEGQARGSNP